MSLLVAVPQVGMDSIQTMTYGLVAFETYLGITEIPIEIPLPEPIDIPLSPSAAALIVTSIRRDRSFVLGTAGRSFVSGGNQ